MAEPAVPLFGRPAAGVDYPLRACVFGLCQDEAGRLALARLPTPDGDVYDLPGGGIDPGETDLQALAREFLEEAGLPIAPLGLLARARQIWTPHDGPPRTSNCAFFHCVASGPAIAPTEPDHQLCWIAPLDALRLVRHDAHAWAITAMLRTAP